MAFSCGGVDPVEEDDGNNPYVPMELSTRSIEFLRQGNAAFTFDYISRIDAATTENYIVSPLSMQFLLGMVLNGARGETAAQISRVLGYGAGETDAVNAYCRSLLRQLPLLDKKTRLTMSGAVFVDDGWPLLDSYKEAVGENYDATVSNLNFSDARRSLQAINGWCSEHTEGLVPKVLDEVSPDMLAYLLNALYFKSRWAERFNAYATGEETFTDEGGNRSKVKMMKQEAQHGYAENEVFRAVRLPYGNGAFSMLVFLPREGYKVADVLSVLKKTDWESFRREWIPCEVDLWLPRFQTRFRIHLNDHLSAMGMPLAFDREGADFKAMSPYALCLSFVQQDAVIKVDEEGTEAAAVSSAGMEKATAVAPGEHVVFHADHPFLYLVSETASGAVLFAGRYAGE